MSKLSILKSIFAIGIVNIFWACSSMNSLTIGVTEPAPVYLPSEIETIGIINRSLPSEKNKSTDDLDKILSAEGKNLDKEGAEAAIDGLSDELIKNDRFYETKILEVNNVKSAGLSVFPSPLSWDQVERICQENEVDAIFELSFYDTDANFNYNANPVVIDAPLGVKIPAVESELTVRTFIKTGWRIYDPINRIIQDEFLINDQVVASGRGINPVKAAEAVIGRKESVMQVSNYMGHNYALRILPYHRRVSREYYVRGTDNFETGKRRAQTGDWNGAAELWEMEVNNTKSKIAGRACYNMGIINEINGDLDAAVDWTSKSYTDHRNKEALDYLNTLKYRIEKNAELRAQME
jgi:hypothetical protein